MKSSRKNPKSSNPGSKAKANAAATVNTRSSILKRLRVPKGPTRPGVMGIRKQQRTALLSPLTPLRLSIRLPRVYLVKKIRGKGTRKKPQLTKTNRLSPQPQPRSSLIELSNSYGEKPRKEPAATSSSCLVPFSKVMLLPPKQVEQPPYHGGEQLKLDDLLEVRFTPRNSNGGSAPLEGLNGIVLRVVRSKSETNTWIISIWGPDFPLLVKIAKRMIPSIVPEFHGRYYLLRTVVQETYPKDFISSILGVLAHVQQPKLIRRKVWTFHEKEIITEKTWFLSAGDEMEEVENN